MTVIASFRIATHLALVVIDNIHRLVNSMGQRAARAAEEACDADAVLIHPRQLN